MKVYFYVNKDKLESVLESGYLSIRAMYNKNLSCNMIEKYKLQFLFAYKNYPSLKKLIDSKSYSSLSEKVLDYLDWRDIKFNNGSNAIYFLYYPIPYEKDVLDFIKKYRYNFIKDKVLLEYDLHSKYAQIGRKPNTNDRSYWISKWNNMPKKEDLWFANIPHGYFVPPNGMIHASKLKIVDLKDY